MSDETCACGHVLRMKWKNNDLSLGFQFVADVPWICSLVNRFPQMVGGHGMEYFRRNDMFFSPALITSMSRCQCGTFNGHLFF